MTVPPEHDPLPTDPGVEATAENPADQPAAGGTNEGEPAQGEGAPDSY